MEEILEAKVNSCSELMQALTHSLGKHLVEADKSDIFSSSGLNPQEAHPRHLDTDSLHCAFKMARHVDRTVYYTQ